MSFTPSITTAPTEKKIQFQPVTAGLDLFTDYPKPWFVDEIFNKAKTEQLLLVGGNGSFNKGQLQKYVAVSFKTEGLDVKECAEFDDFLSLSVAIQEESKRSVFIPESDRYEGMRDQSC